MPITRHSSTPSRSLNRKILLHSLLLLGNFRFFTSLVSASPLPASPRILFGRAETSNSSSSTTPTTGSGPFPIAQPSPVSTTNSTSAGGGATSTNSSSSSSSNSSSSTSNSSDTSKWLLTTTDFNRTAFENQAYVANGYIGARIPAEGIGYRQIDNTSLEAGGNGWPLFGPRVTASMVAGFYDHQANTTGVNFPEIQGGEQPISLLPTWTGLYVTVGNSSYDTKTPDASISNWTQSMSIQNGVVSTSLNWTPEGSNSTLSLNYTIYAHRTRPNLGIVRLDISNITSNSTISVTDVLDGIGAWRSNFTASGRIAPDDVVFTAVQPNGIYNVTAYEVSSLQVVPDSISNTSTQSTSCYQGLTTNDSTISQCWTFPSAPSSMTVIKYVGIASTDAFPRIEYDTAVNASVTARSLGWDALLEEHSAAWDAIWESGDIEIPGEQHQDLQLATRASLYGLLANVRQGNESTGLGDNSIAPAGLTSDSYAGQIFWDADIWMSPGLLALHPSYAESIPNYRYRFLPAAEINAAEYNSSGSTYPWTGARYGNCTAVGPCFHYEQHLSNDIALSVYQYYASTQNRTWLAEKGWPIMKSVADFWASYVTYNSTTLKYETANLTDPDEYANHVDNPAFTNAGIQVVLRKTIEVAELLNETVPSNWSSIASNITVLTDPSSGIVLESEGFNGTTVVKQADVILLTYPLEYNQSTEVGLADLDFSAGVTSPNGPGMTWSVFSIDAAQLSPVGCASWTYLLKSSQPYSRAPYYQFSEQIDDNYATNGGTNPAFTFLTGMGGFLQTLTHGYSGYRSRSTTLYLDPSLPPQLEEYTIKGLKWGNSSFDIQLTSENTTISRRTGGSDTVTIEIPSTNPSAGNYSIVTGGAVTIPTRKLTGTLVEGNVAQCASVLSNDTQFNLGPNSETDIYSGGYRLSAIDGSNATAWQPATNISSTMTVDLGEVKNISQLHFNWAKNPSTGVIVAAGSSVDNMTTIVQSAVNISAPFNEARALEVAIEVGNTTDFTLPQSFQARYLNVTIAGSWLGDGLGATLAEFAAI